MTKLDTESVTWLYECLLGRLPENEHTISSYIEKCKFFQSARVDMMNSSEFKSKYLRLSHRFSQIKNCKIEDKFRFIIRDFYNASDTTNVRFDHIRSASEILEPILKFREKGRERVIFCCGGVELVSQIISSLAKDQFGDTLIVHFPLFSEHRHGTLSPLHLGQDTFESPFFSTRVLEQRKYFTLKYFAIRIFSFRSPSHWGSSLIALSFKVKTFRRCLH